MQKKEISFITVFATIILVFVLAISLIIALNNVIVSSNVNNDRNIEDNIPPTKTKLDANKIKEELVIVLEEKKEYNNIEEIIYFEGDIYGKYSEENRKLIDKDLKVIIDALKTEKNSAKVVLTFKYVTEKERVYSGRQFIDGYEVRGSGIDFKIVENDVVERKSLSVVNGDVAESMVKASELEDIIVDYFARNEKLYELFQNGNGIKATCTLHKKKNTLYWNVGLQSSESIWGIHSLNIYEGGMVEYIKPPEPIFNSAE